LQRWHGIDPVALSEALSQIRENPIRAKLAVREAIVRARSKYISLIRSLVRRDRLRVAAGTARSFAVRFDRLPLSAQLRVEIAPLPELTGWDTTNQACKSRG
jgi:hypothetical protein